MAITRQTTGTTALGANLMPGAYLEKVFVSVLRKRLVAAQLGKPSTMPEGNGTVVRWQFFSNPTALTTALTEGADPANSTNWTTTTAQATLSEYGGVTELSKFLMLTALSGTQEEIAAGLGYQASLSIDTLVLDATAGLTSVSTLTVDAGTSMTADAVRQGVSSLVQQNAKPHRASPGGAFYCALFSGEAAYDMMGEGAPAWFQVKSSDYQNSLIMPFEDTPATAAVYGAIVKISTNIPRNTTPSPDDDLNVLVADDSFGVAALDTNVLNPRLITTTPEQNVAAYLRNRGSVGWWILFSRVVFDGNRIVLMSSDATGVG